MKQQTTKPKIHRTPPPLQPFHLDEEEQILMALAQLEVVDGLLYAEAIHPTDSKNMSALELMAGLPAAACRLTRASLDTFNRLDIVQRLGNARGENARRQGR